MVSSTPSHKEPRNLEDLVEAINEIFGSNKGIEDIDVDQVQSWMEAYQSNANDWEKYAFFDEYRYTRNLIDDGNGKFNLLLLCWGPGHQSAVHDHSNSHCIMKILAGELVEQQYAWPTTTTTTTTTMMATTLTTTEAKACNSLEAARQQEKPLEVIKSSLYDVNKVTYIHDKIGLHRVGNPNREQGAVSLHLYAPPIRVCQTFNERNSRSRAHSNAVFHSVKGALKSSFSS